MIHARFLAALLPLAATALPASAQGDFVNWESPHVHPLDLTPNGARLLAVNTADDRLEVFDAQGADLVRLPAIPVGLDPVTVRARTNTEAWVVCHVSDSVAVVDLPSGRVLATLETDDEPADVVFAGTPQRAFVSCSQANSVLVFDPSDLSVAPTRIEIDAEEPRALAVSAAGDEVYAAVFESGNQSTILGGGSTMNDGFPPNVVSDPAGPYGGVNPPPNDGATFDPPQKAGNPAPPAVGLIVKRNDMGQWMDDNGGDWTALVSGAQAAKSGRPVGWDLPDRDVAVIQTADLSVTWVNGLMNICAALAVHPTDGRLTVVGTDGTNEVRFEPVLEGRFLRVEAALVDPSGAPKSVVDLNDHLDYLGGTIPQSQRDLSLGDPRGVAWNAAGTRAWVTGMGSNNLITLDAAGARAGLAPTVEVGEGPTGVVLDEPGGRLFVLNKFAASISVVDLASELETAQVAFHDPSPPAIKVGRKHLYDTHKNSGLGQIACASCHVDARMDRLAWDLGDPAGDVDPVAGNNLAAGIPFLDQGFDDFHPMKGPMLTQTLRDIIGLEPFHWRGDRNGLEQFNGAFVGLQGDDAMLTAGEMQEYEDFLATIHFPPNPYRNLDNTLPSALPLEGHFTTGRFAPAGLPLGPGDAQRGLTLYRPPNLLDAGALACSTCHTLPVGVGPNQTLSGFNFVEIPPGPNGERHHALVAQDGSTNVSMKIPQLRNLYERVGFNTTQGSNRAGFGYLHDGSVDSVERFLSEPVFTPASDQDLADLVAFMLAFSGSDLPGGSPLVLNLEPPGPAGRDTHAAVGTQSTLVSLGATTPEQMLLLSSLRSLAGAGAIGLVAKGSQAGEGRGYAYLGGDAWQSDRAAELLTTAQLEGGAAPGSELTFLAVPLGTETRIGVDRDGDGHLDRDELDAAADPDDAASVPGPCGLGLPAAPTGLVAGTVDDGIVELTWGDAATNESFYVVERSPAGAGTFAPVALLPAGTTHFADIGLGCGTPADYRVLARNCAGDSAFASASGTTAACASLTVDVTEIPLSAGGTQNFALDAGATWAGEIYLLVGSVTGTSPGLTSNGVNLPLNYDVYTQFTLDLANLWIQNSVGFLDGAGAGSASLTLGAGFDPTLAGLHLDHAYVLIDLNPITALFASNPVPLDLVP